MSSFKHQYRSLEVQVLRALRDKIEASTQQSKHIQGKCIVVNIHNYDELAIVNDRLVFISNHGYHYSPFNDCNLEDLIDILDQ